MYPAYINSTKTRAEGRLLSKDKCLPNPTIVEIRDVLVSAGFQPIIENKKYPRERSLVRIFYVLFPIRQKCLWTSFLLDYGPKICCIITDTFLLD
jgi:signal recognition particle subunit SEC65